MIEYKEIDYVLAIAKHKNISKAAEELYISQPGLTKYLKNLESRLGVELFHRGKKHLTLTPIGELYITYAKDMAIVRNNLESEIIRYKNKNRQTITIGFACNSLRQYLYHAVAKVRKDDPDIKIVLTEMTSRDIENSLLNYQLDLGFITIPNHVSDALAVQLIMEDDILLGVPASHPLSSMGTPCFAKTFPIIDLANFRNDQFVLRNIGTRFREITDVAFANCGFTPEIATTARNHFSCIEFAENWKMCVLTTETFTKLLKDPNSMRFFTVGPIPLKVSLGLAHRKNEFISLSTSRLLSYLHAELEKAEG